MPTTNLSDSGKQDLRRKALEQIASEEIIEPEKISAEKILEMNHELRVHQIELEMQNEDLRRTQAELETTRARYFDLYNLAPVGYLTISNKGIIVEANLTAAALFGVTREHLLMKGMSFFIAESDHGRYYSHVNDLFRTRAPRSFEIRCNRPAKQQFWALIDAMVVDDQDGLPTLRAVLSDISERIKGEEVRQKYEQQSINTQKLESLGLLAGGIAHDFNNLMGGIFGYIDLANVRTGDETVKKYLLKALAAMDRAKGLTGRLLTFATGGAPIRKTESLMPFLQETAEFALSGSNLSCQFDISEGIWPADIDKNQIGQVIDNLIINAQQAMPLGGTITMAASNVSVCEKDHPGLAKGEYIKVAVRDFGVGIVPEIIAHVFDPFFTTKSKGHGLGLTTCYSIVHRHNGLIEVESEPGKGSTFSFFIPASPGIKKPDGIQNTKKTSGTGTILIMDDEEVVRDTVSEMLKELGYNPMMKKNGSDVIASIIEREKSGQSFAAVILDLTVPGGMGGKAAVEEIRKTNPALPVFVSSGYADDPVIANPQKYGFTGSIVKPFRITELSELLHRHVSKE